MSYHLLVSSPRVGHHNYRLITTNDQEPSPEHERLLTRLDQEVRNRLGPTSEVYESELILALAYDAQQLKGRLGREVLILCAEHDLSARPQLLATLEALKPVVNELIQRSEVIKEGEHSNLIYNEWFSTQLKELPELQSLALNEQLLTQLTRQLSLTPQPSTKVQRKAKLFAQIKPKVLLFMVAVISLAALIFYLIQSPESSPNENRYIERSVKAIPHKETEKKTHFELKNSKRFSTPRSKATRHSKRQ